MIRLRGSAKGFFTMKINEEFLNVIRNTTCRMILIRITIDGFFVLEYSLAIPFSSIPQENLTICF